MKAHSWLLPARDVGFDDDAHWIAEAWWNWGSAANWLSAQNGQPSLPLTFESWSRPWWLARNATTRIRVWPSGELFGESARWATVTEFVDATGPVTLPWNKSWRTGAGTDRACFITLDDGTVVAVQNLRPSNLLDRLSIAWALIRTGREHQRSQISEWDWVCDAMTFGTEANAGKVTAAGAGAIPKHVGILTAEQLANGITQPLSLVVANSMMGPGAIARGPGTRVEHLNRSSRGKAAVVAKLPLGFDRRMVPCGGRFVVDRPIAEWVGSKPERLRRAARKLGDAAAEWGLLQKETGDGQTQGETEGVLNPESRELFAALGLRTADDFRTVLTGLIRGPEDLRVVKEAA